MTDWGALTRRTLGGIEVCDPIYRPTNFWSQGLPRLLDDFETKGLDSFKSWPTAASWFYPTYGNGFTNETIDATFESASQVNPAVQKGWFASAMSGTHQARRDFDAARLVWDQSHWPFDLEGLGESAVGRPPESHQLMGSDRDIGWTRPYLNYLLCLAGLSHYVDSPPRSVLEIGGGFGVLGEIVLSRDPDATYVNFDIPPLLTVASFYLDALFGGRVTVFDDAIPDTGPIEFEGSGCFPNWRIADVPGPFDVFVNSFSFQEMEPGVVEHYVSQVASKQVSYVVSLNSRAGKPKAADGQIGVVDQVTSARIIALFEARGYELLGRHGNPLIQSSGELAILRRYGLTSSPVPARSPASAVVTTDLRRQPIKGQRPVGRDRGRDPSLASRLAHDWVPPVIVRAVRRHRDRTR